MLLAGVKLLTLPPLTEISPTVKLLVASLKVNVIAAVSPTFSAAALLVMLRVGARVSMPIAGVVPAPPPLPAASV